MGKPIVILSTLLLVLTYLFFESRIPGRQQRPRMQQNLQTILLHDAELNRDVLIARVGLLSSYDSLAETSRKLTRNLEALKADSIVVGAMSPATVELRVATLANSLQLKLSTIEYPVTH